MKKWKVVLSLLLILIFSCSPGLATKRSDSISISMDGKKYTVKEVPIVMDGQAVYLDIPTFIHPMNDYTLVSVRFVAERYGAKVSWDQKTKSAIITQKDKEIRLTINSKDVYINGNKKVLDGGVVPKMVTFLNKDSRTMVPLRFISETLGYEVGWDNVNRVPFINTIADKDEEDTEKDIEEDIEKDIDSIKNKVVGIKKEIMDGKEAVVVYNTNKTKTNLIKLKNPERIVLDLMDSSLEGGDYFEYDYDIGFVKGLRVSQFQPDDLYKPSDKIVRLVLDIKDGVSDPNVKIDTYDDRIVIIPETSIWELIEYSLDGSNRIVSINANKETNYDVEYDSYGKTMTISIPSKSLDLEEGSVSLNDGLINDITLKKSYDNAKVLIRFRRSIEYTMLSRSIDNKIVISLKKDKNIKPSDMIIVIDPGHGGKDPGAIQNGLQEKDINLSVSNKVNEGLKNKGYTTIMTRNNDTFVDLKERGRIANDCQADIFVSIHANSHPKSSIEGIQVLYHPTKDDGESYLLAKVIMDELLKGTGAKDKGIIERPNLAVLRISNMPATLIELGFLSNSNEAKALNDNAYQDILAESIIKGIEKYFELY